MFLSNLTHLLMFSLSLQTLMTASRIHVRTEEPASMRSTLLCVFVCPAMVALLVKKVKVKMGLLPLLLISSF